MENDNNVKTKLKVEIDSDEVMIKTVKSGREIESLSLAQLWAKLMRKEQRFEGDTIDVEAEKAKQAKRQQKLDRSQSPTGRRSPWPKYKPRKEETKSAMEMRQDMKRKAPPKADQTPVGSDGENGEEGEEGQSPNRGLESEEEKEEEVIEEPPEEFWFPIRLCEGAEKEIVIFFESAEQRYNVLKVIFER